MSSSTPVPPADPLSGHLNHLTPSQSQAFQSFKSLLVSSDLYSPGPPPSHDDSTLLRFLRARRFDPQGALGQFGETERWRREAKIDAYYEGYDVKAFDEASKVFPGWTGRRARSGVPFYVYRVKDLDKKKMERYYSSSATTKVSTSSTTTPPPVVALYEHLIRLVLPLADRLTDRPRPETPIVSSCNLIDITGVGIKQFFGLRAHLGEASGLATAKYPETLNSIFVVGAPSYIELIFSFVAQWFDPITRSKIHILSTTPAQALSTLSELIDPSNIPKTYGGQLDWQFGDPPSLDQGVLDYLGIRQEDWKVGPGAVNDVGELLALGRTEGGLRREVVGRRRRGEVVTDGAQG